MSEKHLTELPWKVLATKHGVKDTNLQKALAAYSKLDPAKVPKMALDALKDITELVVKCKKGNSAKEEVVDYLDEIIKEVKKITPGLEKRAGSSETSQLNKSGDSKPPIAPPAPPAKEAEEDEDEEEAREAAEFKKDLKKQMVAALGQVKLRTPDPKDEKPKPQMQFMAYLAGDACAVIVARKVGNGTKKLLPDIIGGVTGGKFISGECIFEKNVHTFVLDQVPGGLRAKLEKALQLETGTKCKARVRSFDGKSVEESDGDDTVSIGAQKPPPAPPGPPANDDAIKFKERLATLLPQIKAKPQAKLGAGTKDEKALNVVAAEAGAFANKNDFVKANQLLDAIEAVLKQGSVPTAPPKPQDKAPTSDTTSTKQIKLSTYLTGRSNLRAARENSEKELKKLQQAILTKAADEPFFKEVEAKSQKLFEYLAPIDESLVNKLDEAGRCTDAEEQVELNKRLRELIQKQLGVLRSHPLGSFMENNPFGKFAVRQPLEVTLSALDQQLS
jgi:hypothetical protein